MQIDFVKEDDDKWYAVVPDWPYAHEELEMVEGADELLDWMTLDDKLVSLEVYTEEPASGEYYTFVLTEHDDYGGTYTSTNCSVPKIWLCNVMHFVFDGEHPESLYIIIN